MEALKITEKIIRENAFEHKKKKPGLGSWGYSNNWALKYGLHSRRLKVIGPRKNRARERDTRGEKERLSGRLMKIVFSAF